MHYCCPLYYFNLHFNMLTSSLRMFAGAGISETGRVLQWRGDRGSCVTPVPSESGGTVWRCSMFSRVFSVPPALGASPAAQGLVLWGGPTAIHIQVPTEAGARLQAEWGRLRVTEGAGSGADRVRPLLPCARCTPCLSRPVTSGLTAQHPQGPEAECRGDSPCRLQTVACGRDLTLGAAVCSSVTWG